MASPKNTAPFLHAADDVAGQMLSELYAQLDDFSDDTVDTIRAYPQHPMLDDHAENLRTALREAVETAHQVWRDAIEAAQ